MFEFRQAVLLERLGKVDDAIAILEHALASNLPYGDHSIVALLTYRFNRAITGTTVDEKTVAETKRDLEGFVRTNPSFTPGVEELALQRLFANDYQGAAVAAFEAANQSKEAWSARRTLVIALAHLNRFNDAKSFIRPAVELHNDLLADRDFMFAAALAYVATGDVETARQVLKNLSSRDRSAATDDRFKRIESLIPSSQR